MATFQAFAASTRARADDDWVDALQCAPFVCRANFELAAEQPLLDDLLRLQHDLDRQLGIEPSRELVELYLFDNKTSYRDYLARRFPEAPVRRAMFIKGAGQGMVYAYRSRELAIDLRHEATHALLHASIEELPLWLDEGLAEYFEAAPAERVYDHPHLANLRWDFWHGVTRLAELEHKQDLTEMGRREYRDAWAWVHFCLHGPPEAREEFSRYLIDLRAGLPTEPLSRRLERRVKSLDEQFARHIKAWKR